MLSVEACVIAFERRSHLGPLVEGRPGPSDDDDGDGEANEADDDDIDLCHDCGAVLFLLHPSFQKLFPLSQRQ